MERPVVVHKEKKDIFDRIASEYLDKVAGQTRGSYRVRSANVHGSQLVHLLRLMPGTAAEQSIVGYLVRARQRTKLATKRPRKDFSRDQRLAIVALLLDRLAFEEILKLDRMEALDAIARVSRCAHCRSWFWGRIKAQRYCSEGCRVRHYHASPEGKKYKRDWARKDYQLNKKRNEEARRSALRIRSRPRHPD
jgi:hypothetical protein